MVREGIIIRPDNAANVEATAPPSSSLSREKQGGVDLSPRAMSKKNGSGGKENFPADAKSRKEDRRCRRQVIEAQS
jgi:hypothetical protein